jgi:hypothetical protein
VVWCLFKSLACDTKSLESFCDKEKLKSSQSSEVFVSCVLNWVSKGGMFSCSLNG